MDPTLTTPGAGVVARGLTLAVPDKELLSDATFAVPSGRRVALVGRNGSGKSTLLETILALAATGAPPPHVELRGGLELGPGTRVAGLPQSPQLAHAGTVAAYLDRCAGEVGTAWNEHERLTQALAAGADDDAMLAGYGEALEAMQRLSAWDWPQRRHEVLAGLGLPPIALDRDVPSLSGGEATRVALAGVLVAPANLILLDEPTNNLDLASLRFLAAWLVRCPAGVLVVSHDRDFLDEAIEEILEVEERTGHVRAYGGNFTFYAERKAAELEAQRRAWEQQESRRERLEGSMAQIAGRANRFESTSQNDYYRGRGRKVAKLAKSQATRIERELTDLDEPRPPMPPRFTVLPPAITDGALIRARNLTAGPAPGAPLVAGLDLTVAAATRTVVVGPNGAGKTMLLRTLLGELPPLDGTVESQRRARIAHLHQSLGPGTNGESLLAHVQRLYPTPEHELRPLLGKVVFGDPARLRAADVSEGERRRAECAGLFASQPDLVVLDEPTNHLDLPTIEMLESALDEYRGAVLAVSHDRRFLRRLHPDATVMVDAGRARVA
jgi:ATPase subunit of ABC transporter with duplicated ATPase domains